MAEGGSGDLFLQLNKVAAGDDLGLTLQTGFSARALVVLFGSGRFRLAGSVDGNYLFDATLMFKINAGTSARMSGRLVLNGTTEISGSRGEISGAHVSGAAALWLQTMVALGAADTVDLQGYSPAREGYSPPITRRSGVGRWAKTP